MIRDKIGMTPIEVKIEEARVRLFEHINVEVLVQDAPVRRYEVTDILGGDRGKGRPKEN